MRVHLLNRRLFRIIAAVICFLVPMALWAMFGATSFAASRSADGEQSAGFFQQAGTPTPTPGPTRSVGWANTTLPGFTGGLPPTSDYVEKGAGGLDLCSRAVVPPNIHYWVPGAPSVSFRADQVILFTGDLDKPPVLNVSECGGDAAPGTVYTITGPNGYSSTVSTDSNGMYYQLPTGSPEGEYKVAIHSSYGDGALLFVLLNRPNIHTHDVLTEEPFPDPSHDFRVDYANFKPNSSVTVGLYRLYTSNADNAPTRLELIDQWSIQVDAQGRYSEILPPPPQEIEADGWQLVACALENCTSGDLDAEPSVPLAVVGLGFFASPASRSPEEALHRFFDSINNREYGAAYAMLSDNLLSGLGGQPDASAGFAKAVASWDTLSQVQVDSLETIAQTSTTATIEAHVSSFIKTDGSVQESTERFDLIWDNVKGIWTIKAVN